MGIASQAETYMPYVLPLYVVYSTLITNTNSVCVTVCRGYFLVLYVFCVASDARIGNNSSMWE